VFHGKKAQAEQVQRILASKGFMPNELVPSEVAWFYENLGIDDTYFAMEGPETIASHILALFGAKIVEYTSNSHQLQIDIQREHDAGAVFIHSSKPGVSEKEGPQWERLIDEKYLNPSSVDHAFRLETYRSKDQASRTSTNQLRSYFLWRCEFVQPIPEKDTKEYHDIRCVSDQRFLNKASDNTLRIYQGVMEEALFRNGPVIEMFEVVGSRERRVVIGYRMGSTYNYFSALSDLYHFYGLYSSMKYVEQFR